MKKKQLLIPLLIILALLVQCSTGPGRNNRISFTLPEKKSVMLSNGETYAYLEQLPDGFENSGEIILLIHGNNASSVHFAPLFSGLDGVHIIAPDLRGFGDSSYNEGFSSLSELAEDVKLFADALGISKAHVAGWSMGGGVAMELAVLYPDMVSSLFLIQGVGYKGMPFLKANDDGSYEPYAKREELAQLSPVASQLEAFQVQDPSFFRQSWGLSVYTNKKPSAAENSVYIGETLKQRCLLDVYWAMFWFNMSSEHNGYVHGLGTVSLINCPVALTCADNDLLVPPAIIMETAAAIPGSRLLEYRKCGHSPMVDMPQQLAADIINHTGLR